MEGMSMLETPDATSEGRFRQSPLGGFPRFGGMLGPVFHRWIWPENSLEFLVAGKKVKDRKVIFNFWFVNFISSYKIITSYKIHRTLFGVVKWRLSLGIIFHAETKLLKKNTLYSHYVCLIWNIYENLTENNVPCIKPDLRLIHILMNFFQESSCLTRAKCLLE